MDYKTLFGIIAAVLGPIGYIPYFINIFKGKTKPHVFSWGLWGLLLAIAFFAQITEGAGSGAWVTGISSLATFCIAGFSLTRGEKHITKSDTVSFIAALFGIVLWRATKNPLTAVFIVTAVDALGFFPTFRKTYYKPYEETATTFALSSIKFIFGILALQSYSLTTWFFPAYLVVTNAAFVTMVFVRRKSLGNVENNQQSVNLP